MSGKLHHAVVVSLADRVLAARAFATSAEANAFADGVIVGVESDAMFKTIYTHIMDERGSLAVNNEGLAAAKAAGWSRKED